MLNNIEKNGIAGAGGAGFPTHFKLGAQAEYYIINAAECEPLLASDRTLMLRHPSEIIQGIKRVREFTKYKKAIIGIKEKNKDCADLLQKYIDVDYIEILLMKNVYPSGDEQIMIYEATGRVVPEGGIPLDIGVIVNNVETVFRIEKALKEDEPFVSRYVTVTGEINTPFVMEMSIGTPFIDILERAGKKNGTNYIAIDGGPMMGKVVDIDNSYVKKTTSGIIFLDKNHTLILKKTQSIKNIIAQAQASCCNCMTCTELCSRYLIGHRMEPHKIMRSLCSEEFEEKVFEYATLCSECNICELYACPINLSPRTVNSFLKGKFREKGKKISIRKDSYTAPDFRSGRQLPTNRIVNRLDLKKYYDNKPVFTEERLIPENACILLDQHIGAPAKNLTKNGDLIKKGDLIGEKNGNISANIHSPFNGKIIECTDKYIKIEVIS